jgi:hypothetical protein
MNVSELLHRDDGTVPSRLSVRRAKTACPVNETFEHAALSEILPIVATESEAIAAVTA